MEFVALIDLVKTVTKNKVKNIDVLGNPDEEGTKTASLYDAISKGQIKTDVEAATLLYGKKGSAKSTTYLRTKNRLIRQLINTSIFIDVTQPMFNDRAKALYNCYRDFVAATILIGREAPRAGVDILEQVLEQTVKYEFTQLTADVTRTLRGQYARTLVSQDEHEKMAILHRQYEEKRRLEMLALDYFENLINYYIVRRSPNEAVHATASAYFDELLSLAEETNTSQFYYYTYQIGIIKYLSVNDCTKALEVCDTGIEILKNRKNTNRAALANVVLQKIACLTQLRGSAVDCEETVQFCLSLVEEGDLNWFRTHELHLHYCLFARRYEDALDIFVKTSQHEKFLSLGGTVRDNWQLFGGYLHLLAALGKLDTIKVTEVVGTFKYSRLTNEIEVVAKDKQGMNIPLLLLPVIYALVKGNFEETDISPEGLEKYRKRYLDTEMNRRSSAFLDLLLAFSKKEYNSASAERKIKKELAVLAAEQPNVVGQTFAVEIIPYEDLWEMMTADG
jgi:hypothetical protein